MQVRQSDGIKRAKHNFHEYKMDHARRGFALIFNNQFKQTSQGDEREGTEHDVKRLEATLMELGFSVVIWDNLSAKDIKATLNDYAKREENSSSDCFFAAFLTHGKKGFIYGNTGLAADVLELSEIPSIFSGNNSPRLLKKPKILLVQACRGDERGDGHYGAGNSWMSSGEPSKQSIGSTADILFTFASSSGYKAARGSNNGSVFVSALCQAIEHYRDNAAMDFIRILTAVTYFLATKDDDRALELKSALQVPTVETTLRKLLFLSQPKGVLGTSKRNLPRH